MKKIILSVLVSAAINIAFSQTRVLFLGNSYTSVNNLPQLTADCAASIGLNLEFNSNTPGGYTFQQHTTNTISQDLINSGNWDYIVLQEQSQIPSFPDAQVASQCYPFAEQLNNQFIASNPCGKTVFYMTWGRQNGDASNCANWPPVCTYEGMDSLLNLRYRQMALDNEAVLSPVGAAWRQVRNNYPNINLYSADGSHPSAAGSYVAALCMNVAFFQVDPTTITFNSTLDAVTANTLKSVVKEVVFNNLWEWQILNNFGPSIEFLIPTIGNNPFELTNNSSTTLNFEWLTDEGDVSTLFSPVFQFESDGPHTIYFNAFENGCLISSDSLTIEILSSDIHDTENNLATVRNENSIHIKSSNTIDFIDVYDLSGKLLVHTNPNSNTCTLPCEHLAPVFIRLKINGVWIIRLL
jgi:hypothetical protein